MYVARSGTVGRFTGPDIHDKKMLQGKSRSWLIPCDIE